MKITEAKRNRVEKGLWNGPAVLFTVLSCGLYPVSEGLALVPRVINSSSSGLYLSTT